MHGFAPATSDHEAAWASPRRCSLSWRKSGFARTRYYSINFSFGTIDNSSWHWRRFPALARFFQREFALDTGGNFADWSRRKSPLAAIRCVYPQTVRLREDMTVYVKKPRPGARRWMQKSGYWYQRYLPSTTQLNRRRRNFPQVRSPRHARRCADANRFPSQRAAGPDRSESRA